MPLIHAENPMPSGICNPQSETEKEFRRDNIWYSFTGALYSAVSTAAFIGVLGALCSGAIAGTLTSSMLVGGMPLITAMIVVGIASTYFAQREFTKLKCIQDEHLAIANALHLSGGISRAPEQKPMAAAADNSFKTQQRADGKLWTDAVCTSCAAASPTL